MPRIPGTTDAQSLFLRAFLKTPSGPPPEDWPSPRILSRWLKNPPFQHAWAEAQAALQFQIEFQQTGLSLRAAESLGALSSRPDSDDPALREQQITSALALLDLAHRRERFSTPLYASASPASAPPHSTPPPRRPLPNLSPSTLRP